jgi:hypothetical protein
MIVKSIPARSFCWATYFIVLRKYNGGEGENGGPFCSLGRAAACRRASGRNPTGERVKYFLDETVFFLYPYRHVTAKPIPHFPHDLVDVGEEGIQKVCRFKRC